MATEDLVTYRVGQLEGAVKEIRTAIVSIDRSLAALANLHDIAVRVRTIEDELPTLKIARKWVLAAMTGGGAAVGAGVLALVVK